MLAPLHAAGIQATPQQVRAAECSAKLAFDAEQRAHTGNHGFWDIFYSFLLQAVQLEDVALKVALIEQAAISAHWDQILPGTLGTLASLRQHARMAIISNADGRIESTMHRLGLMNSMDCCIDSGKVGFEKPHPKIFNAALLALKVQPQDAVYVGDVYSIDYLGATAVGMNAVIIDACGAYRESALPRVETLEELEPLLFGPGTRA